ncbi:protein mono-ADP-ribosyltransferase PARP14-like [Mya arenaria]|uniref:protein mono-ADP-ribosyltransferase PARP14-like n=1 Tax=Mya arenaria TaxID=6604 RepID=UPI0022E255BE|nr:protein mono-ADP-ribosyltransferase PARP14-like [Mya arenaria]
MSCHSIALPALGTGNLGYHPKDAANAIFLAVCDFVELNGDTSHLQEIKIVIYKKDENTFQAFKKVQAEMAQEETSSTNDELAHAPEGVDQNSDTVTSTAAKQLAAGDYIKRSLKICNETTGGSRTESSKLKVHVLKEEIIISVMADAIVNSTSDDLNLENGYVSAKINRAAGKKLQKAVHKEANKINFWDYIVTEAFDLSNCKHIFHCALEPLKDIDQNDQKDICLSNMRAMVRMLLNEANKMSCHSIALPALGTGNLGYHPKDAANAIFLAVCDFVELNGDTSHLQEIKIVIYKKDENTFQAFKKVQAEMAQEETSSTNDELAHAPEGVDQNSDTVTSTAAKQLAAEKEASRSANETTGGSRTESSKLKVHVLKEEIIISVMADAIVNSTSDDLNLENGYVSAKINRAAGKKLQKAVHKEANKINFWDYIVTEAFDLSNCKHIFHCALEPLKDIDQNDQKDICLSNMRAMVRMLLNEANKMSCHSIALPALGTGNLGYHPKDAANAIFLAVCDFVELNGDTSHLQEIKIVIYKKDENTFQAFKKVQAEMAQEETSSTNDELAHAPEGVDQNSDTVTSTAAKQLAAEKEASRSANETTGGSRTESSKLKVHVLKEEIIISVMADAIVNSTSDDLNLENGYVSAKINRAAGKKLQKAVHKEANKINFWDYIVTEAFDLSNCKHIFHCALEPLRDIDQNDQKDICSSNMRAMVRMLLNEANKMSCHSIALPALGTGNLGYHPKDAANAIFLAVCDFVELNGDTSHLQEIKIVIYKKDENTFQAFKKVQAEMAQEMGGRAKHAVPALYFNERRLEAIVGSPDIINCDTVVCLFDTSNLKQVISKNHPIICKLPSKTVQDWNKKLFKPSTVNRSSPKEQKKSFQEDQKKKSEEENGMTQGNGAPPLSPRPAINSASSNSGTNRYRGNILKAWDPQRFLETDEVAMLVLVKGILPAETEEEVMFNLKKFVPEKKFLLHFCPGMLSATLSFDTPQDADDVVKHAQNKTFQYQIEKHPAEHEEEGKYRAFKDRRRNSRV